MRARKEWEVVSDKHLLVGQVIALERGCASHELPIGDACLKRGMQRVYAKCVPEEWDGFCAKCGDACLKRRTRA
jgi:hypothetical protein